MKTKLIILTLMAVFALPSKAYDAPQDLSVSNITATSATVSWSAPEGATKCMLRYRPAFEFSYFCDFDDVTSRQGWSTVDFDGDGYNWEISDLNSSRLYGLMSRSCTEIYDPLTPDNWAISPQVELSGVLTFYASLGQFYYFDNLGVYIIKDEDEIDQTEINAISQTEPDLYIEGASYEWTKYTIDLSSYQGKGYIAFRHYNSNDMYGIQIDDVSITPTGEVSGWWTFTTSSPLSIYGLKPGTEYEVQVLAVYEEGKSEFSKLTFTTRGVITDLAADNVTGATADISWTSGGEEQCDIRYRITPPLSEDFETPSSDIFALPGGWTTIDADGDGWFWTRYEIQMLLDNSACVGSMVVNKTTDDWLVTPEVKLDGVVRFVAGSVVSSGNLAVYVSTESATDVNDFEKISDDITISEDLTTYEFDLSDYAGERGYIAIRHYNCPDMGYALAIDDFVILYNESVSVDNEWIEISGVTENPYTLIDLDPQTEYDVQIRGIEDDYVSDWSKIVRFTTLASAELAISLADDGKSNTAVIEENDGKECTVTLEGRTLYKDDSWNTICLPFDLASVDNTPLAGADIRALGTSTVSGHHVSLSFDKVEAIEAGYPYIVKWESGENVVNPVFKDVTIDKTLNSVTSGDGNVNFIGYYDAFTVKPDDNPLVYYLTSDNKLRYTSKERTLNACRAYFTFTATDASNSNFTFSFDFGDGTDGITGIVNSSNTDNEWYTLDGRKISGKPVQKGIYVTNGQKVVIK